MTFSKSLAVVWSLGPRIRNEWIVSGCHLRKHSVPGFDKVVYNPTRMSPLHVALVLGRSCWRRIFLPSIPQVEHAGDGSAWLRSVPSSIVKSGTWSMCWLFFLTVCLDHVICNSSVIFPFPLHRLRAKGAYDWNWNFERSGSALFPLWTH